MTNHIILQNGNHPIDFFSNEAGPANIIFSKGNTWDDVRMIEAPPVLTPALSVAITKPEPSETVGTHKTGW